MWHGRIMGLIRLFLALVVAGDHWRVIKLASFAIPFEDSYKFGFNAGYAVMFFYVISGFLITYTLSHNYSRDLGGSLKFYVNRFIRIFSLYWPLVLVAFLMVNNSWQSFLTWSVPDKLTGIFLLGIDWRLSFASYPQTHFSAMIPGLEQAWTLGAELSFYLVAPLLMRSWKIGAALLAASFGLRAVFAIALGGEFHQIWSYHFVGTTFGFFMLGHLICLAARRWRWLSQPLLGWVIVICSFAMMTFGGSYAGYDTTRFWGAALLFTLALPGLFEGTKNIRWMNAAGDLSYPVYLVHTLVLYGLGAWLLKVSLPLSYLPPVAAGLVSIAIFVLVTTAVAFAAHRLLEVPIARAMHKLSSLRGSRKRLAPPTVTEGNAPTIMG
jgi:peptidoglycan/LPS O-acetylase OafA/YrhL